MRFLVFVCLFLAAEAAKLQGYSSQEPSSGGVAIQSLSREDFPSPTDLFAIHSNGESFSTPSQTLSSPGQTFSTPGQSFSSPGQTFSNFDQSFSSPSQTFSSPGQTFSSPDQSFSSASQTISSPSQTYFIPDQSFTSSGPSFSDFNVGQSGSFGVEGDCGEGQVRHVDGSCVTPEITRNVFVYAAPEREPTGPIEPIDVPLPKVEHNIVFIKTEDQGAGQDPIIVPPPQKKHIIYVLNKDSGDQGQRVIEVSTQAPKSPEVYFVNYGEGETPTLPDGIDFQTALNSAVNAEAQVIGGGNGNQVFVDGGNTLGGDFGATSGFENGVIGSSDGGFSISNGFGSTSGFGGGVIDTDDDVVSFVSLSDANGGSFLSGNAEIGNLGFSSGGSQTFVTNDQFSGNNINGFVGSSGNDFQFSSGVDTSVPQPFYTTP